MASLHEAIDRLDFLVGVCVDLTCELQRIQGALMLTDSFCSAKSIKFTKGDTEESIADYMMKQADEALSEASAAIAAGPMQQTRGNA